MPTHRTHGLPPAICTHVHDAKIRILNALHPAPTVNLADPKADPKAIQLVIDRAFINSLSTETWRDANTCRKLEFVINNAISHSTLADFIEDHFNDSSKPFADFYNSLCTSDAGAWLEAPGTYVSNTSMNDTAFVYAVHLRLQTQPAFLAPLSGACGHAVCKAVPHSIHHGFGCPVTRGAKIAGHHALCNVITSTASFIQSGLTSTIVNTVREPSMQSICTRLPLANAVSNALKAADTASDAAVAAALAHTHAQAFSHPDAPQLLASALVAKALATRAADAAKQAEEDAKAAAQQGARLQQLDRSYVPPANGIEHNIIHRGDVAIQTIKAHGSQNPGPTFVVDVSVTHGISSGVVHVNPNQPLTLNTPGAACEFRSKEKMRHYTRRYIIGNIELVPLIFETGGRINKAGIKFINTLAKLHSISGARQLGGVPLPFPMARTQLVQRLSVTLQTYNARLFHAYHTGHLRADVGPGGGP